MRFGFRVYHKKCTGMGTHSSRTNHMLIIVVYPSDADVDASMSVRILCMQQQSQTAATSATDGGYQMMISS